MEMKILYCDSCKKYTFKEVCKKCGKKTTQKAYKFKFKWANRQIIPEPNQEE